MPKQPSDTRRVDFLRTCCYKWEFLRRNSRYQADWNRFQQQYGRSRVRLRHIQRQRSSKHINPDLFILFTAPADDAEANLALKWHTAFLESPAYHLPLKTLLAQPHLLRRNPFAWRYSPAVLRGRLQVPDGDPAYLQLTILLRKPKVQIVNEVRQHIERALVRLKAKQGPLQPQRRNRFASYDDYLKTWDLREAKVTWRDIAKRLYPTQFDLAERRRRQAELFGNRNPLLQRCIGNYKRAKQFIEGGYTEIT